MGFWESFKESYRVARDADVPDFREEAPFGEPHYSDWSPPDEPRSGEQEAADRVGELEVALRECMFEVRGNEASLRQRDGQIAESRQLVRDLSEQLAEAKQLIVDLAAELERLGKELKVRPPAEGNHGSTDGKFQRLRRFVLKKIHPDLAGGDKKLCATLQVICKEINAEIERIERA